MLALPAAEEILKAINKEICLIICAANDLRPENPQDSSTYLIWETINAFAIATL